MNNNDRNTLMLKSIVNARPSRTPIVGNFYILLPPPVYSTNRVLRWTQRAQPDDAAAYFTAWHSACNRRLHWVFDDVLTRCYLEIYSNPRAWSGYQDLASVRHASRVPRQSSGAARGVEFSGRLKVLPVSGRNRPGAFGGILVILLHLRSIGGVSSGVVVVFRGFPTNYNRRLLIISIIKNMSKESLMIERYKINSRNDEGQKVVT